MTKMLYRQLKELEQNKENCRIWLGSDLSFFGKVWRMDANTIELITFVNEDKAEDLATSSRWIIPIRSIAALGHGWHTLSDKEPVLQFADKDPIFKKDS